MHTASSTRSSSANDPIETRTDYDVSHSALNDENEYVQATQENSKVQRLMGDKTSRLIDWNVDVLLSLLKQIVARREITRNNDEPPPNLKPLERPHGKTVIDEVTEIITLPEFDAKTAQYYGDTENVTIDEDVVAELLDYVTNVAIMYNENPFHCKYHAEPSCIRRIQFSSLTSQVSITLVMCA